MRGLERPEPLERLIRRSDRRCFAASVWFLLLVALALAEEVIEAEVFEGAATVMAVVDDGYRPGSGDLTVPVRIDGRLVETRPVYDAPLPAPGAEVRVEVAAGQPREVRLTAASYPLHIDWWFTVVPFAVCAVLALGRRRFVRQVLGRAGSAGPSFGLTGVIRPATASRYRCVLDLYALDAPVGVPPIAAVPLATTAGLPFGVPIPVECKGVPRPFSLVVARCGGAVLWPSSPAVGGNRRAIRPEGGREPGPLPSVPPPPGVALRPLGRRPGVLALPVSVAVLVLAVAIGWVSRARDDERRATWLRDHAAVVDGSGSDCEIEVAYGEEGHERTVSVPRGGCTDVAEGPGYVVLIDPDDPGDARLLGDPYDPWSGVAYAGAVVAGTAWWCGTTVRRRRRLHAAIAGPWSLAAVDLGERGASFRAPTDPSAAPRCWVDDRPAAGQADAGTYVAGTVEPGARFASWAPGRRWVEEHRGRSRPPWRLPFRG